MNITKQFSCYFCLSNFPIKDKMYLYYVSNEVIGFSEKNMQAENKITA